MEYVTVEFYFDESKNKTLLDKARKFIMKLFNQMGFPSEKTQKNNRPQSGKLGDYFLIPV